MVGTSLKATDHMATLPASHFLQPRSLGQIDTLSRQQAAEVVDVFFAPVTDPNDKAMQRCRELAILLQMQALEYGHQVAANERKLIIDIHVHSETQRRELRSVLLSQYAARRPSLQRPQAERMDLQQSQQIAAADQYNEAARKHMEAMRAHRPPIPNLQTEDTRGVLIQNSIDQLKQFHAQQRSLFEEFESQDLALKSQEASGSSSGPPSPYPPQPPVEQVDPAAYLAKMNSALSTFWSGQDAYMSSLPVGTEQDFKTHNDLPLARIKRIMKSDEDVRMISAEAPVLFAKAVEMFILEVTIRSWNMAEQGKRRTLQKEDLQGAIKNTEIFDFLVEVVDP
mmetsp:Transcript_7643/g.15219  ORF Transcript_7643/g.15219 Transcript_7643/m.15219 type:complete len:339 (-) Transcript_7643:32-1048(-)